MEEVLTISNPEIEMYQRVSDKLKYTNLGPTLNRRYHTAQSEVIKDMDDDNLNCYVLTLGRRAQPLSSKILTPTGYVTMNDIKVGQEVLSPSGGTTKVKNVHSIYDGEVYKITLKDGRTTLADSEHIFRVYTNKHKKYHDKTVKELYDTYLVPRKDKGKEHKYYIDNPEPVERPGQDLIIPPYSLGLLLGDGCLSKKNISIGMEDEQALAKLKEECPEIVVSTRKIRDNYYMLSCFKLRSKLEELNLVGTYSDTKFIPKEYLLGSINQRLDILRGLMDTDGYIYTDRLPFMEYSTCSKSLMEGVVEIVRSLGGSARVTSRIPTYRYKGIKKEGKLNYRVYIKINLNPFYIDRKSEVFKTRSKLRNHIINIKKVVNEPVRCISVEKEDGLYLTDDYISTHNTGKTVVAGDIATGELLKPYAAVLLLTPTYVNAKILFNSVLKNLKQLNIKIISQNTNQFSLVLENGATFVATSQKTVKNVLGSRISMLIVDETQDIDGLIDLVEQFIEPAMMDYGMKDTGVPYAKELYLGTPRGVGTEFHDLFIRELDKVKYPSWISYNYPSKTNPMLPTGYLELKKAQLPSYVYQMEYEAKWLQVSANAVYFAFDTEINTFRMEDIAPFMNRHSTFISAVDIGFQDSTAKLNSWVNEKGDYYIIDAYSNNKCATTEHATQFKALDAKLPNKPEIVYCDPAAAQSAYDLSTTHNYMTCPAVNKLMEGIACINELLSKTPGRKPRLFINIELIELIRQMQTLAWKDKQAKTFKKDPRGTHYDLALACLRYLVYSYERQQNSGSFVVV